MLQAKLALAALTLLLAAAPAWAQEASEAPADQAWVDDCPPDMLCAAGANDPQPYGDDACIECSGIADDPQDEATAPQDCGAEVCAFGPEGCIECSPPVLPPQDESHAGVAERAPVGALVALIGVGLAVVALRRT